MIRNKHIIRVSTSLTMLLVIVTQWLTAPIFAQTIIPPSVTVDNSSAICSGGSQDVPVQITLPGSAITNKVDVFLLFDDTGSFAGFVPTVSSIFSNLVTSLETTLPGVEFGFGVGRFEDYGGPGASFSSENTTGRPFTLNQPIITAATAGGSAARNTLISTALANTAPGFGGDGPETAVAEGLYQVATGVGFDGDGNGSALNSGPAGATSTQVSPGTSGDVPPFSSNVAPTSGSLGGAGWRSDSLRLVILATDIASVAAFPAGSPIPSTITGAGGSSEPVSAFASSSTTPGIGRFGFVSNAKSTSSNTVAGAVVPAGAGTVQATINALNALGIRVLGMGPSAAPTSSPGPSSDESIFLSALARLTGAVDSSGTPLVFSTSVSLSNLTTAIANAISTSATAPVDIALTTSTLPTGLSFSFTPAVVSNVAPGGTAAFVATLTGDGSALSGSFDIRFVDVGSGAVLGTIPVTVDCQVVLTPTTLSLTPETATNPVNTEHCVTATVIDQNGAPMSGITVDFTVTGVNPTTGSGTTNASGQAQFCYTGANAGIDTITATAGSLTDTASKTWQAASGPEEINAFLRLDNLVTTFKSKAVAGGPAGTATLKATFTNISSLTFQDLFFQVAQLTGGNLLLNADGGAGGVGAKRSVPNADLGVDNVLTPGESFQVTFVIGLATRNPFTFFVDAYGIVVDGVRSSSLETEGSGFQFEVGDDQLQDDQVNEIFLPVVVR